MSTALRSCNVDGADAFDQVDCKFAVGKVANSTCRESGRDCAPDIACSHMLRIFCIYNLKEKNLWYLVLSTV